MGNSPAGGIIFDGSIRPTYPVDGGVPLPGGVPFPDVVTDPLPDISPPSPSPPPPPPPPSSLSVATVVKLGLIAVVAGLAGRFVQRRGLRYMADSLFYFGGTMRGELVKFVRWFPATGRAVGGFFRPFSNHQFGADLRLPEQALAQALGVGTGSAHRLEKAAACVVGEGRAAFVAAMPDWNVSTVQQWAELVIVDHPDAAIRIDKLTQLLMRVYKGRMDRAAFTTETVRLFGVEQRTTLEELTRDLFSNAATLRLRVQQLANRFQATPTDFDQFRSRLIVALELERTPDRLTPLMQELRPGNIPFLLRLVRTFRTEGAEYVRLERLMAELTQDAAISRSLLGKMLGSFTQEEVAVTLQQTGSILGKITALARTDRDLMAGLIPAGTRRQLVERVQGQIRTQQVALGQGQFFEELQKIDGMTAFLETQLAGVVVVPQLAAGNQGACRSAIAQIAGQTERCDAFLALLFGKGLDPQAKRALPKEARERLLKALLPDDPPITGRRTRDPREPLRHAISDAIRPILTAWHQTPLHEVETPWVRAQWREAKRALNHSLMMSGADGDRFCKEALLARLAPSDKVQLRDHIEAMSTADALRKLGALGATETAAVARLTAFQASHSFHPTPIPVSRLAAADREFVVARFEATYHEEAIRGLRLETHKGLADQLTQAIGFTPERGVLDTISRELNLVYNFVARPLDRQWARRVGGAADAVVTADPEMSVLTSPLLWLKMFRRQLYLAVKGEATKQKVDKPVGPLLRRLAAASDFLSYRFGTEELREAHRIFLPIGALCFALGDKDSSAHEFGTVSCILGANYYIHKVGLGHTFAMDIIMVQKLIQTTISKADADSHDLMDVQRAVGSYGDVVLSIGIQTFWTYGLNFAEKSAFGQILGNLPLLRRLPLAMNGRRFFGFYRGSLSKPDFLGGAGFWGGVKSLAFVTLVSSVMSYFIGWVMKNKRLFNANDDYAMQKAIYYGMNGPLANVPGFFINARLEGNSTGAELGTTLRQFVERVVGLGTHALSLQFADIFAGKGDYKENEDRLLAKAASGERRAAREAWRVFVDRCSYDFGGLYYRFKFLSMPPGPESGRTPKFHIGPTYNLKQRESWYAEKPMEFYDHQEHQGYFVELAKQHPERLRAFLEEFRHQLGDDEALWKTNFWAWGREKQKKSIYHFSLIVKSFAARAAAQPEYKPFADFIATSPYQKYWDQVPLCKNDGEIRRAIVRVEDLGEVRRDGGKIYRLDHLMAYLWVHHASRTPPPDLQKAPFRIGTAVIPFKSAQPSFAPSGLDASLSLTQRAAFWVHFDRLQGEAIERERTDGGLRRYFVISDGSLGSV